jgi:hypothetical protein
MSKLIMAVAAEKRMYAPVPVPGVRAGITTLTIEVPQYQPDASAALDRVDDLAVVCGLGKCRN